MPSQRSPCLAGSDKVGALALGRTKAREECQLIVIGEALRLLSEARAPGTVVHLDREWPDFEKWKTAWYPPELPPIIKLLVERLREQAKEARKGDN